MSLLTGTCKLGKHLGEAYWVLAGQHQHPQAQSSCQGSSSTEVLQDVTEHQYTILVLGTGHSSVRRTPGSVPEEVASPALCSSQVTSGSPIPGHWGGSSGGYVDARPGSVGVWHEPFCPSSALRQGAKKSLN